MADSKGNKKNYEIKEHIADLSKPNEKGWRKELNLIKWFDKEPKYDIREWGPEHKQMGKGVTLTYEELETLCTVFEEIK